jgi:hypothetical protein
MSGQFKPGQVVRVRRRVDRTMAEGDYEVIRPLPNNGGEQQYRVKSIREPHERVVNESDIERI